MWESNAILACFPRCYRWHACFAVMSVLVIVDEFDCDNVLVLFFQGRSVSLRSENRKQKPCHLAIIALTTRPVPTGRTISWWVFSLIKGCDSGQCLISEFCISSWWLEKLCPNTVKCTKLFFPVIVQMHIWLWCNFSERTVTSDLPAFILCYHR